MAKDQIDAEQEYNDFLTKRQEKLDKAAAKREGVEAREEYKSGFDKPPAARATDGKQPGTKHENPIVMAAKIDDENGVDDDEDFDELPTANSKVDDIKAYLDAQGITYDPAAKKADLVKLLPAE